MCELYKVGMKRKSECLSAVGKSLKEWEQSNLGPWTMGSFLLLANTEKFSFNRIIH